MTEFEPVFIGKCAWCESEFEARTTGGKRQRFCSTAHRRAFERAARRYVDAALERGEIELADLRFALVDHSIDTRRSCPGCGTTIKPGEITCDACYANWLPTEGNA